MPKRKKQIPLEYFTEKLQANFQQDLLTKIVEVLVKKGLSMETREEIEHIFTERIKRHVHEGLTTWLLDGVEFCVSGELEVKYVGKEIETNFKFSEI